MCARVGFPEGHAHCARTRPYSLTRLRRVGAAGERPNVVGCWSRCCCRCRRRAGNIQRSRLTGAVGGARASISNQDVGGPRKLWVVVPGEQRYVRARVECLFVCGHQPTWGLLFVAHPTEAVWPRPPGPPNGTELNCWTKCDSKSGSRTAAVKSVVVVAHLPHFDFVPFEVSPARGRIFRMTLLQREQQQPPRQLRRRRHFCFGWVVVVATETALDIARATTTTQISSIAAVVPVAAQAEYHQTVPFGADDSLRFRRESY